MATEEQTTTNTNLEIGDTDSRAGQRLTVSDRVITKLSFKLFKHGSPTGNISFVIRKQSDDSVIVTKVWGDASGLGSDTDGTWKEVTFDTQVRIDEEVYMLCEFTGGDNDNNVRIRISSSDEKASEYALRYIDGSGYTEHSTWDAGYIYTYGGTAGSVIYPSVDDVARASSIRHIFRPGFFRMQVGLGDLGLDIDVAETAVRAELDTARDSFKERMERTAKQLQEEAGMSREESLRIARKLETLEEMAQEPIGPMPVTRRPSIPAGEPRWEALPERVVPTREEFWAAYPGAPYPYAEEREITTPETPSIGPKPPVTPKEEKQIIKDIGIRLWRKLRGQQ